jgi:multidrug efflux pump subunit AcrB
MPLTLFALKHRTTILVFVFLLVIVGMVSYLGMPRESTPDIKMPYVMTLVPYIGASPEDVEQLVTNRIEKEFEDLNDVEEMNSTSAEGMSMVVLKFLPDTDITDAMQRVRDRVNRARPDMPQDIEEPEIREISSSDWPIVTVNVSGDAPLVRLKNLADDLADEIEKIDGVLEADVVGGLTREVRIEVNPHLLRAAGISLQDVTTALAAENVNVPGGHIDQGKLRYTLRIDKELKDPLELENYVVGVKSGRPVRVHEIGRVVDDFKEVTTMSRYVGKPGVSISVKKNPGANIIKVVAQVKRIMEKAQPSLPKGTTVAYLNDQSDRIAKMVNELENNIIAALVLVLLVLFLFIGGRNAVFVAVAIPLSMLVSFMILASMDVTLNFVVLFSLVLALGMLVDNAIVVVENIYRHYSVEKKTPLQAAEDGTAEVYWAVFSSTLTTVAVFVPLLSWPGIMGKFMGYLPLTLIVTLSASFFVAVIINPVIAASFMPPPPTKKSRTQMITGWLGDKYELLLLFCIRHGAIFVGSIVVFFVLSVMALAAYKPMVEFFPSTTPETVAIDLEAQQGSNIFHTDRLARQLEEMIKPETNVKHFVMDVGAAGNKLFGSTSPINARATVDFLDRTDWKENPLFTIERLRARTQAISGAKVEISKQKMGPPSGAPVNIEISGDDFTLLSNVADEIQAKIKGIKGLTDLSDDYAEGRPELGLVIDPVISRQLVENPLQAVAGTVRTAIFGTKATQYRIGENEYDVTVRLQDSYRLRQEDVMSLTVAGKEGKQIPISQIARIDSGLGTTSIRHLGGNRVVTVSGEAEGRPGAEILMDVQKALKGYKPRGADLSYTGENKEMAKSQAFMAKSLLIGIFLIAIILLTQFNSFSQVSIILFTVLLSLIGVFWGIIITGMNFSVMMTGLGIISLAGVVVNNGIVLIDFINQQREKGRPLKEAVVESGRLRTRPVLLTAGTTVLGLVPMAQGIDIDFKTMHIETGTSSMEFWGPMAVSVIYGLTFATILTLLMVPALYYLTEKTKCRMADFFARHPRVKTAITVAGLLFLTLVAIRLISGISAMMNS